MASRYAIYSCHDTWAQTHLYTMTGMGQNNLFWETVAVAATRYEDRGIYMAPANNESVSSVKNIYFK